MTRSHAHGVKRRIQVRAQSGVRSVDAVVYGRFALHQSIVGDELSPIGWTVTHLQSGYSVDSFITKPHAERLIRECLDSSIDWNFDRPEDMSKRTKLAGTRLKHRIAREEWQVVPKDSAREAR